MMIPNQTLVTSLAQHVLTAQNTSHRWDAAPSPQGCISMVTADYPDDPIVHRTLLDFEHMTVDSCHLESVN